MIVEIEAKIVEYVLSETLDIGVAPIDGSTPIVGLPESGLVPDVSVAHVSHSIEQACDHHKQLCPSPASRSPLSQPCL